MASGSVYTAIRNHIEANWSALPVAWENEPFNPPATGIWIYIEMTGTIYEQKSIGAADDGSDTNRWDEEGVLYAYFHMTKMSGTKTARDHAKAFADLFRAVYLDGGKIEFLGASIGQGQLADDERRWFQIPVTIDWRKIDA